MDQKMLTVYTLRKHGWDNNVVWALCLNEVEKPSNLLRKCEHYADNA